MIRFHTFTAAAVTLSMLTGQSFAAGVCVRPEEASALKTAALQQELMVAAFTCHDIDAYNRFVISYRRDLQDSDATMLKYFERASAQTGSADYNSYKTSLANDFSLAQIRDTSFCPAAGAAFGTALDRGHPALEAIVATQPFSVTEDEPACDDRQANAGVEVMVGGGSSALAARR